VASASVHGTQQAGDPPQPAASNGHAVQLPTELRFTEAQLNSFKSLQEEMRSYAKLAVLVAAVAVGKAVYTMIATQALTVCSSCSCRLV